MRERNFEPMADCIMYVKGTRRSKGHCDGLNDLLCAEDGGCPFYKPSEEYDRDGKKKAAAGTAAT